MRTLAKNISLIRKELECTQLMMAKILKIGFRTYVRYEAGERDIPVFVLIKLAYLGGISLEQISGGDISSNDIIPCNRIFKVKTSLESKLVDFRKGWIVFKKPARSELMAIDSSEKKLLSIFRKMDADLQSACIKSLKNLSSNAK